MSYIVSVIVPAYNAEKTIGQCLQALKQQNYPSDSYEVILVNDGSKDATGEIAQGYDITYLWQENQGPATARNKGAKEAKGEIILFTDSDCVPDSNWIREMVAPFSDQNVMAVKGAYKNKQKSIVARFAQLEFEERFEMLKKAESIDMVDTYSAGFRKDIFLQLDGFDTSFPVANNEDTELSYRMSKMGYKMVFNPNAIVFHLDHPDSVKRYARLKFWRGYWRAVVYKKFPDKMLKDTYTPQTLKLQIFFLLLFLMSISFSVFSPAGLYAASGSGAFFFLLSLPLMKLGIRKDCIVGLCVPFLLVLRAGALGFGMLWGMVRTRFN
ncbi:MAG: glycosyltransferase [Candidatus Kuenenia sp.]|nr:glycosyltransferase [Candidatus Kuenenia hertensis]